MVITSYNNGSLPNGTEDYNYDQVVSLFVILIFLFIFHLNNNNIWLHNNLISERINCILSSYVSKKVQLLQVLMFVFIEQVLCDSE